MTAEIVAGDAAFARTGDNQAWARWAARSADALMLTPFVLAVSLALGALIELGYAPAAILTAMEDPIAGGAIELLMIFIAFLLWEPLFISNTGTTPGKWIMGIRVRRADGQKLSFFRAVDRFVRVWIIGMGAGIPLLTLILMLMQFTTLSSEGSTAYDRQLDVVVEHRKRHPLLWALVIIVVIATSVGLRLLNQFWAQG